jgi:hypothetical protein
MPDVQPHQTNDKMEIVLHDPAPIARPVQFVGWSICGSNGWAVAKAECGGEGATSHRECWGVVGMSDLGFLMLLEESSPTDIK